RVSVLPLIEHLQRFAPCCLLAVVDFAQVQNLPLCYFPRLQTPTFHHRVIAVFLPVLDPRIAAQKHSQLQNARNCPPCIEGRSPLQALAKIFCSARMTCRDDSPTFRPKSVSTAKVGVAAMRSAVAARHTTLRVPLLSPSPPLMSCDGHNPSHEAKFASLFQRLMSSPTSLIS